MKLGTFEFIFNEDGIFYDPTNNSTPSDVMISIYRGDLGSGATIDGPFSYLFQDPTPGDNKIVKTSNNVLYFGDYGDVPGSANFTEQATKFSFEYKIPDNLFPGNYSVVATTSYDSQLLQYVAQFQVPHSSTSIDTLYAAGEREVSKSFVPAFQTMEQYKTNSVLLIGHADGVELNDIIRITNIQEAIDLLKADFNSPLLRGVFDSYASGCRDIYICASAPMSEYVEELNDRLVSKTIYGLNDATPVTMTFYQRYYDRLSETYSIIQDYDYLDIIVPLEISFINTNGVDFVTQLAMYCQNFHNNSGMIQIGIIGSRNGGITSSDIDTLEDDVRFLNKYTMFDSEEQIIGDMGRFVIPIYGELIMNHTFLTISYVSSGSAIYAGMLSSNSVNQSLIRKIVPSAFGLSGVSLSQSQVNRLDNLGINTFTKNTRTRRGNSYQIYVTNDNTLAHPTSNYRKAPQIRLVSMLINEIRALTNNTLGKFAPQKASSDVQKMLQYLKSNGIVADFEMEAYMDPQIRGKMYFDVSVTSSLGLKKISFSISSGQGT